MKYIFITNDPERASSAYEAGVERFMVDLEIHGKQARQGHKDTFITSHNAADIAPMRAAVTQAELMVRINPLHKDSQAEIDHAIDAGADLIMLPMFTDAETIEHIRKMIAGRAKFVPLFEHYKALEAMDEILANGGIDEAYLGLNDLHLSLDQSFLFAPLLGDWVEQFAHKATAAQLPFGFGGMGSLRADVAIPPRLIMAEHVRLGSSRVILSRAFQNLVQSDALTEEVSLLNACWTEQLRRDTEHIAQDQQALQRAITHTMETL